MTPTAANPIHLIVPIAVSIGRGMSEQRSSRAGSIIMGANRYTND